MAAARGTKNRRAAQIQEAEVLNSVKGLNFDSVSRELATVQVEVQKTLAELSAKLSEQLQKLDNIEETIRLKQEELKQLHQIEATSTTLDELEAEIREKREAWAEEQDQWKRDFEEMKQDQRKAWKREEDDYQYQLKQKHTKTEDALQEMLAQKAKANREQQEQLEKQWSEREAELKKREQELGELREFKASAPEMIKKAVNADVAIATNSLKKEYEHKQIIAAKDAETDKRLAESQIQGLQQTIIKQQAQIDDLRAQLVEAHQRVTEISHKALESASGRATTEALQRLMEKDQISSKSGK
jgi:hypothetical protein